MRNLLVAQSGGPTAAINATVAGVVSCAVLSGKVDHIYGAVNGIEGVLAEKFLDLGKKLDSAEKISLLMQTPAAALGSCRYKLGDPEENKEDFEEILQIFRRHEIRYFIYIGGNDSMDTVDKMSKYCKENGVDDVFVVGAPKTIDNDLVETDHTPGFASAAKYVATTVREIAIDASVYDNKKSVTIVEIMGRHAGWLTAASALARKFEGDNPVLIYLPEVAFNQEDFIEKVKHSLETTTNLIVCVSEGIHDGNGTFICEYASDVGVDTFGHKMLTGSGKYLENLVKEKVGVKVRSVELNVSQRCSSSCLSKTDLDEAVAGGAFGVNSALAGETGKMISFKRVSSNPYVMECTTADVTAICNKEKGVPIDWITENGSNISDEFINYASPLIQGEVEIPMQNGLPHFAFRK